MYYDIYIKVYISDIYGGDIYIVYNWRKLFSVYIFLIPVY